MLLLNSLPHVVKMFPGLLQRYRRSAERRSNRWTLGFSSQPAPLSLPPKHSRDYFWRSRWRETCTRRGKERVRKWFVAMATGFHGSESAACQSSMTGLRGIEFPSHAEEKREAADKGAQHWSQITRPLRLRNITPVLRLFEDLQYVHLTEMKGLAVSLKSIHPRAQLEEKIKMCKKLLIFTIITLLVAWKCCCFATSILKRIPCRPKQTLPDSSLKSKQVSLALCLRLPVLDWIHKTKPCGQQPAGWQGMWSGKNARAVVASSALCDITKR